MKRSGFTLIELAIVIAIMGIIAAVVLPVIKEHENRENGIPERPRNEHAVMHRYLNTLYPTQHIVAVTCGTADHDGDGYVACTAQVFDATQERKFAVRAECPNGIRPVAVNECVEIGKSGR